MKKVKAIITGGKSQYGIWIDKSDIYSAGNTLEEAKANLNEAIKFHIESGGDILPAMKGNYEMDYYFDISGYLKFYSKYINFAGMSEITGIHQKQLWNYAHGYRKPSIKTTQKIIDKISTFLKEMSQAQISL